MPCARILSNADLATKEIAINGLSRNEVLLESQDLSEVENCDPSDANSASIDLTMERNNRLSFQINASSDGWFLLADSYYPGWRAFINGEETEIYAADLAFRAIQLPKGNHEVEFVYQPTSFYLGAGISGLTLAILVLLSRMMKKRELD